jgi:type II secretory ATPase GspE/PulE/Tfp pilus assembly ATPase PilB-like protein
LKQLNISSKAIKLPRTLYKGSGCKICGHTGYVGQVGIYEVLRVTDGIRSLMLKSAGLSEIRRFAQKEGMQSMFEDGMEKVERGMITLEEVLRVVRE